MTSNLTNEVGEAYPYCIKATGYLGEYDGDIEESNDGIVYEVSFDSISGSEVPSQFVEPGDTAEEPEDPEYENYSFNGWYEDREYKTLYDFEEEVDDDIVLFAKWWKNPTVSFNSDGGTAVESQMIELSENVIEPEAPVKEHNNFIGWYTKDGVKFDFTKKIVDEGDFMLYAHWWKHPIVTFETNGGSAVPSQEIMKEGDKAAKPADPMKADNSFGGWYGDKAFKAAYDFSKAVSQDTIIYAKWNPNSESAAVQDAPVHHTDGSGATPTMSSPKYGTDPTKTSTFVGGTSFDIKAKFDAVSRNEGSKYSFKVSDKKIAKASSKGVVKPKKKGNITISLVEKPKKGSKTDVSSCNLYVQVPQLDKKLTLTVGASANGLEHLKDVTYRPTAWASSKPEVCKVDRDTGVIVAVKKGNADIYAIYGGQTTDDKNSSGKKYCMKVKVN